jgi:hypothetical protein
MPVIPKATGYTATGHEETPKGFDKEFGSSQGSFIPDLVPELNTRHTAARTYNKMARTDAVTSVSLRAGKTPVLGADYYIDPVGDDQNALDVAEFVSYNIFEGMTAPYSFVLSKILKMYQDGFAVVEPCYWDRPWSAKRKNANTKTYTMLRKLAPRPATTIQEIIVDDNGGPVEIIQQAIRADGKAEEVHIPIEKAIIFPFGEADNLYGESVLRSAYPHWFYKTHLYKIDAIQKERHGIGIPRGTLPPGYSDKDKEFLGELLSNLRTNERAYVTQPPGYIIDFVKPEGQLVDVLKSAHYHDVAIMLNIMVEFMMVGLSTEGGGGRATSATQADIFWKSTVFIASLVCDCFNMFLIPNLVKWNFETEVMPLMKVRNIGQSRDLQQFASALANVFDKQVITPDLETEQWARKIFDMPQKTPPEEGDAVQTPLVPAQEQVPAANGNVSGIGNNGNTSTVGAQVKSGTMGKAPTEG